MGLFTRSKMTTSPPNDLLSFQHSSQQAQVQYQYQSHQFHHHQQQQQQSTRRKFSFTDPPNVYLPQVAPSAPHQHPYSRKHNLSQPNFKPVGSLPAPRPTVGWTSPPGMIINASVNTMQQVAASSSSKWTEAVGEIAKTVSAYDDISRRFDDVMTMIDCECLKGHEMDLFACAPQNSDAQHHKSHDKEAQRTRPRRSKSVDDMNELVLYKPSKKAKEASSKKDRLVEKKGLGKSGKEKSSDKDKGQATNVAASVVAGTYFSKVECYANARLPSDLPPLALYMSTWPLLCLAAQFSQSVYERPRGAEREAHVPSDWRSGTKAMRIKSVPMDAMNTIVFAIRGTASFMDWAVNLNSVPVSPEGFLDDPGNLCHQGFLSTARSMVAPVARRLADLLEENPNRSRYSLMITGHSAGGAVASLLYCHMLAQTREARSELNAMTDRFKRVHCVTFGSPPVSLLPLLKPSRPELRKSLFMSFINEGDPVVRAEKPYVKSLLELLASPVAPAPSLPAHKKRGKDERGKDRKAKTRDERRERSKTEDGRALVRNEPSRPALKHASTAPVSRKPIWNVPEATLSNAGRLIILRSGTLNARANDRKTVSERLDEGVVAVTCQEEQLRGCVFGDPVAHMMALYAGRIEILAVGAVTGKMG